MGAFHQDRPVFRDGQLAVKGRRRIAGLHVHCHVKFACGLAPENAVSRRNVGVITAYGSADVPVVGDQVVGGVKANPPEIWKQYIDPGVGGVGG